MTTECYYAECPHHSANDPNEEGPFCYEPECKASTGELWLYQAALKFRRIGQDLDAQKWSPQ